jgi:hypothetical protein
MRAVLASSARYGTCFDSQLVDGSFNQQLDSIVELAIR